MVFAEQFQIFGVPNPNLDLDVGFGTISWINLSYKY